MPKRHSAARNLLGQSDSRSVLGKHIASGPTCSSSLQVETAQWPVLSQYLLNCLYGPNVNRPATFPPDQHRTRKSRAMGNDTTACRPFDTPSPCPCRTRRLSDLHCELNRIAFI